jgi:hypothetical protein
VQLSTQAPTTEEWSLPDSYGLWKIEAQACSVKIEILYVPNCPNHAVALERIRAILPATSFQMHVSEVLINDADMAQLLKFPGSPTIRVNGQDVEPQSEKTTAFGLMCRLYSDGSGAPSEDRLRAAIEKARGLGD